jgi:hypothetical protein
MKISILVFFLVGILLTPSSDARGQVWSELVPLISTCEDVKRVLKVSECKLPWSEYQFPDYNVTVDFSTDADGWCVSRQTITSIFVSLKRTIKLSDYRSDLTGFVISKEYDAPEISIYKDDRKGLKFSVQKFRDGELYVWDIALYPSKQNAKKFRSKSPSCVKR